MRTTIAAVILGFAAGASGVAQTTSWAHYTVEEYIRQSPTLKLGYVAGVLDGIDFAKDRVLVDLGTCLDANMTSQQLAVLVEEKIRRAPSTWHLSASSAVYAALREHCPR